MKGLLIVSLSELRKLPITVYANEFEEKRIALKVITGYQFDNGVLAISNSYGDLYRFSVDKPNPKEGSLLYESFKELFGKDFQPRMVYTISVWDASGNNSIFYDKPFLVKSYNDPIPSEIVDKIDQLISDYSRGIFYCSDCGKPIKKEDIGGRFFAGRYCKDCWVGNTGTYKGKGGWKKRESEENYE